MRILLVEDNADLSRDVCRLLEANSFHVDEADRGEDALHLTLAYHYETIILDLCLPDMRGDEMLKNLRMKNDQAPLLILSGEDAVESRISCLTRGADDYLIKPFNADELVARMHALVRRANGRAKNRIEFGDLVLDLQAKLFTIDNRPLDLTCREYEMLELLCLRQGSVVSKENFLDHLYGAVDEPETKIIDVFICKLRKKIEQSGAAQSGIKTVWGRGYRIDKPEVVH